MLDYSTELIVTIATLAVGVIALVFYFVIFRFLWAGTHSSSLHYIHFIDRLYRWKVLPAQSVIILAAIHRSIVSGHTEPAQNIIKSAHEHLGEFYTIIFGILLHAKAGRWDTAQAQAHGLLSSDDLTEADRHAAQYLERSIERQSFEELSRHTFYVDILERSERINRLLWILTPLATLVTVAIMLNSIFDTVISNSDLILTVLGVFAIIIILYAVAYVRYMMSIQKHGFKASLDRHMKLSRIGIIPSSSWYGVVGVYYAALSGQQDFALHVVKQLADNPDSYNTAKALTALIDASQGYWDSAESVLATITKSDRVIDLSQVDQLKAIVKRRSLEDLAAHDVYAIGLVKKFEDTLSTVFKMALPISITIVVLALALLAMTIYLNV